MDAIQRKNERRFKTTYNVKSKSKAIPSLYRVAGRRPPRSHAHGRHYQWMDHPKLWVVQGTQYVYTAEPYHYTDEDAATLRGICEELGLEFIVHPKRWSMHYPDHCHLIVIFGRGNN